MWPSLSILLVCLILPFHHTCAQTDDKTRGIQLYNQGDASGAAVALKAATKRNKNDIEAWYYLASAFESQIKLKDARKAHEKAAKLGESLLSAQLTLPNPEFDLALRNIRPLLERAAVSAERYLALSEKPGQKKVEEWRGRRELLRDFSSLAQGTMGNIYSAKDVTTKAVILSKPEPSYTEEARKEGVKGIRAKLSHYSLPVSNLAFPLAQPFTAGAGRPSPSQPSSRGFSGGLSLMSPHKWG